MSTIEVKTQAELDKASAASAPGDVIVCLGGTIYKPLVVRGSSRVEAWGSSRVVARESSSVEAWESSRVVARESSSVVAWGSSRVEAWGSSSVVARESSRVVAGRYASVHKMPGHLSKISGGVVIVVPDTAKMDGAEWCDYYGVTVKRGKATLYKALDDDLSTPNARRVQIIYAVGTKVAAPDWNSRRECGGGLHSCASPAMAQRYNEGATRYVAIECAVAEIVVIDDKVKAPTAKVLYECDRHGDKIEPPS
jgi:hypothetical protein